MKKNIPDDLHRVLSQRKDVKSRKIAFVTFLKDTAKKEKCSRSDMARAINDAHKLNNLLKTPPTSFLLTREQCNALEEVLNQPVDLLWSLYLKVLCPTEILEYIEELKMYRGSELREEEQELIETIRKIESNDGVVREELKSIICKGLSRWITVGMKHDASSANPVFGKTLAVLSMAHKEDIRLATVTFYSQLKHVWSVRRLPSRFHGKRE